MSKKSSRKRWTELELTNLREYIQLKSAILLKNFYQNLVEGRIKFRKPSRFFSEMAAFLKMSSAQCKSKFQKYEKHIYTNYLQLPEKSYLVLEHIRKQKNQKIRTSNFPGISSNFRSKKTQLANEKGGNFDFSSGRVSKFRKSSLKIKQTAENTRVGSTEKELSLKNEQIQTWRSQIVQFYFEHLKMDPTALFGKSNSV